MTNVEVKDKLFEIVSKKEEVLDRCIFTLLPKNYKNRNGIITKEISEKLELEFKIDISDVVADSKIVVTDETLGQSGISKDDLIDASIYNTEKALPARFDSICDVLGLDFMEDMPMYVLTNVKQTFGAGAVLYDGIYEKIFKIIGDFIVIPSSVHEVIVIPEEYDCPYITRIIREVNKEVVDPIDILSDVPYRLTPAGDLIEL